MLTRQKNPRNILRNFSEITKKYIDLLKMIDSQCKREKHHQDYLQKKLDLATNEFIMSINLIENSLPFNKRKHIRELLRSNIGKYIFQSQLLKRFYKKPLGYPGDYLMFEMIYNEEPISKGIGYYFDKYVLEYPLIQAVINRKNMMKQLLKKYIKLSDTSVFRVLNIGCGSSREVRELLLEGTDSSRRINFNLVDQDREGFEFMRNNIHHSLGNIKFNHIQRNILDILDFTRGQKVNNFFHHKMDLIYSVGLIDYFLNNMFDIFLRTYFQLLKHGGQLIIASCSDKGPFCYVPLRWFCEWNFYFRNSSLTKKRIKKILSISSVEVKWEQNQQIFFLIIKKR